MKNKNEKENKNILKNKIIINSLAVTRKYFGAFQKPLTQYLGPVHNNFIYMEGRVKNKPNKIS